MGRLQLRKRTLDPSICLDEELAQLDSLTQLLFQRLPMIADREGRFEDRPNVVKAVLFPFTEIDVDELLEALGRPRQFSAGGFILRYEAEGRKYCQIRNFSRYQNPHHKESPSEIPAPSSMSQGCLKVEPSMSQGCTEHESNVESTSTADPDPDPDPDKKDDPSLRSGSEVREDVEPPAAVVENTLRALNELEKSTGSRLSGPQLCRKHDLLEDDAECICEEMGRLRKEDTDPIPTESPPALELQPTEASPPVKAEGNPYHFVVFWQDANTDRDFGLRFEPETGPSEFLEAEVERLNLAGIVGLPEVKRVAMASLESFKATYSKRSGRRKKGTKPKTRGSSLHPEQLTEEFVAWVRKDLSRLTTRASRTPVGRVDQKIATSTKRVTKTERGKIEWRPRKQSLKG